MSFYIVFTEQFVPNVTISVTSRTEMSVASIPQTIHLSAVHLTAVAFVGFLIFVSALLGIANLISHFAALDLL